VGWGEIVSGVSGGGNRGRGGLNSEGVIVGSRVEEENGGRGGKVRRGFI